MMDEAETLGVVVEEEMTGACLDSRHSLPIRESPLDDEEVEIHTSQRAHQDLIL